MLLFISYEENEGSIFSGENLFMPCFYITVQISTPNQLICIETTFSRENNLDFRIDYNKP
jgi:hypothetical protein